MQFLFDRQEWADTLNRLSPASKLYWRENFTFTPTIGRSNGADLYLNLKVDRKKGKYPNDPSDRRQKELENAIASVAIDRGWIPRGGKGDTCSVNGRRFKFPAVSNPKVSKGFVYLIRNGDLHKVGITTDLKRRMEELKPDEIINVVKRSDYEQLEKDIHQQFKSKRLPQSEYFRFTDQDLEKIEELLTTER